MDYVPVPSVESYKQLKERISREQADKTKAQVLQEQGGIDLDNMPKATGCVFVDRGAVIVCEGAQHPTHRHWKK